MDMKQEGEWIEAQKELPKYEGWYLVRTEMSKNVTNLALHYRLRTGRWYVSINTNNPWSGLQPERWFRLAT